ncbi:MAG: Diacylglycerol kinase [Chroococcopsis gigantea SAG 12.99]|jgi:YegS/Rv2252/BmrU family lipid kinase|nr:YegS/Rv2252/BmrU family lipid kinase [Chlorogloea purpurea SAG 13.99]MDV2999408.1 Diacylglycerol kinase [Chroococcopsis gigantea SAG 12.99]
MPKSACLIFNPSAGQGNPEQDLALIQSILNPEIDIELVLTTPDIEAGQLAREAIARGAECIIASGGDGTLSAVAEALIGTDIPLGAIARGTANAFVNALNLPVDIGLACQNILGGVTRQVDAALCNGKPMILLAGIGFEAQTVEKADRATKDRLGMLAYVVAGIAQLGNLQHFDVEIETEEKIIRTTAVAVTVANAAPPTSILAQGPAGVIFDDGLLDITIVAPANMVGAIAASYDLLSTALSGEASSRPDVGYLRASKVKITTEPPQKVVVDGEPIGTTPIVLECLRGGLTIYTPDNEEPPLAEKLEGLPNLEIESK